MREWAPEVVVDANLARSLIREQFQEVELRSLRLLGQGWDNTVWLVDEEWVFRFPRKELAVAGLRNEIAILPRLAPLLPLPIPVPTLIGEPSERFRWPFFGAPFLPGRELADTELTDDDRIALARPLATFLRALHGTDLDAELPVDPVRRADMAFRVPLARERLAEVERLALWRAPRAAGEWLAAAEELPGAQPTTLVHGDLHLRHLLVDDGGRAAGVIDWIDVSRNDPAVDFVLYWSVLPPEGRASFLDTYGPVAEAQLLRARVLSLFLCAVLAVYGYHERLPKLAQEAVGGLARTADQQS